MTRFRADDDQDQRELSWAVYVTLAVVVLLISAALFIPSARWWRDHGDAVAAVGTIALIGVTLAYVIQTDRMVRSQRRSTTAIERQATAAEEEVGHLREALATERAHGDRLYRETVLARLSAATPVVLMRIELESLLRSSGLLPDAPISLEEFRKAEWKLVLRTWMKNAGPGPAIVTPIPHARLSTAPAAEIVLDAGGPEVVHYHWLTTTGELWEANWLGRDFEPIVYQSGSPLTDVTDVHTAVVRLVVSFPNGGTLVDIRSRRLLGGGPVAQRREMPTIDL